MAGFIDVQIDTKSFERQLDEHKKLMPYWLHDMIQKVQRQIVKETKLAGHQRGYKSSSPIIKNVYEYTDKQGKFSYVGFKGRGYPYNFVAKTTHIEAKKSAYLTFFLDGSWHKVKSVELTPDPYFDPIVAKYWNTGLADRIMQELFDYKLQRLYKREMEKL